MKARDLPTWREAWTDALYGQGGFFRRENPGDHFRTSVHASPLFADALLRMVRDLGLDTIVDVGAGGGELLRQLDEAAPGELALVGVDVASRPEDLPNSIRWREALPAEIDGLIIANEWLDNIPCDVLQVDHKGVCRYVHVDPQTGTEALGDVCHEHWMSQWWPLTEPGTRAEIGSPRDRAWADAVRRLRRGLAIAIDFGHTADTRPTYGSLAAYQRGNRVEVIPDGSRDITAHVAVDSLYGERTTQRAALTELGVAGDRPDLARADSDPQAYVQDLGKASQAAELTALDGLGEYSWVVVSQGVRVPFTVG